MTTSDTVWTLCHGRGGPYLDALCSATREQLESARERVGSAHDADFPMDAARRLEQFTAALLDRDLRDACAALQAAIEARLEVSPPPSPEAVTQAPALLAALAATHDATRDALLAAGDAAAGWIWLAADEVERLEWTAGPPNPDVARFEELAQLARGTDPDA